jgi:hypothetical protein
MVVVTRNDHRAYSRQAARARTMPRGESGCHAHCLGLINETIGHSSNWPWDTSGRGNEKAAMRDVGSVSRAYVIVAEEDGRSAMRDTWT